MSAEETGKVPSALAREIAELLAQSGLLRMPAQSYVDPVRFLIDREIAKAGAFIPAETLEQVEKAMEEMLSMTDLYHNDTGHDVAGASMQGACDSICDSREPLRIALAALRSERGKP